MVGRQQLVASSLSEFVTPGFTTVDLRVEKTFAATSNVNFTLGLDLFNALNEGTVLARNTSLEQATADWVQDVLSPRVWKIGIRISWK